MSDLSGTWLGTYWQNGIPTRFEATFVQGGKTLTGRILDDCSLGEAQVAGEVVGRSIQFTKQYLTTSSGDIRYTGTISEDVDFMSGQWSISVLDSGPWEARRSGDNLTVESETRAAEEVPAVMPMGG